MSPRPSLVLVLLSITVHQVRSESKANKSIVSRVVGGRNATNAPYQVLFSWMLKSNPGKIGGCGGTILNKRYILTAKHCVDDREGKILDPETALIKVVVGELNWCKALGIEVTGDVITDLNLAAPLFTQDFESVKDVSEVHVHPEAAERADIAILKVNLTLKISQKVWANCEIHHT